MTPAELAQVEDAKDWFRAFEKRKNRGLHEVHGVALMRRVIELEGAEAERDELLRRCSAMRDHLNVNLQRLNAARDYTDQLEAEVQRLKEWQEKALEYVREGEALYKALIKMGIRPSDERDRVVKKADAATVLIAQAQEGGRNGL